VLRSAAATQRRIRFAFTPERGTLDIVFANAGAGSQLALGKITAQHIDETFDTNVKGSIFTVQKALPLNLARTWAEDLKGTGIRVNVLSPGATATELAKEALGEEGQEVFASMTPLPRMADPAWT
jgi:NAD(P)-dependent dehydrogenase (short-subunit alcohol dehydrogenase family)